MAQGFRRRVARSRLAGPAAFAVRATILLRHERTTLRTALRWLATSQEHTNFTYDLTPLNTEHLAWFVSAASEQPVWRIREYLTELRQDRALRDHVVTRATATRRSLVDSNAQYGRRAGWYALVRALKPELVVETGTDKGLGSLVIASALRRNGGGRLMTIDINPDSGSLIAPPYSEQIERIIGDSVVTLEGLTGEVDFFLHDSDHSPEHEAQELVAVTPHLSESAVVLSDNSHGTMTLPDWAEKTGRNFRFFAEKPADHWYPGAGIGLAYPATRS